MAHLQLAKQKPRHPWPVLCLKEWNWIASLASSMLIKKQNAMPPQAYGEPFLYSTSSVTITHLSLWCPYARVPNGTSLILRAEVSSISRSIQVLAILRSQKKKKKELAILWTTYYTLRREQFYRLQWLSESKISDAAEHTKTIGRHYIYTFLFPFSSTELLAIHRSCCMRKSVFAASDKQDWSPPASHRDACSPLQVCRCYRAAQAALACEHQSISIIEGALDLEQCRFWRAEE